MFFVAISQSEAFSKLSNPLFLSLKSYEIRKTAKSKMVFSGVCPIKYNWTKAYLLRPIDNIISHPDVLRKRPFRPSYDSVLFPDSFVVSMFCFMTLLFLARCTSHFMFAPVRLLSHLESRTYQISRVQKNIVIQAQKIFALSKATHQRKHLIPNLESKCRLCLSDKTVVQSIFQCESKETTDTLVDKIFECTAIMLSKDFDFPSPICEDCALKLDEFLLFRAKCLRSNEIYRFNKLHKSRLFSGGARLQSNGYKEKDCKEPEPADNKEEEPKTDQVDKDTIGTSSSSDETNITTIKTQLPLISCVLVETEAADNLTDCNEKPDKPFQMDDIDTPDMLVISETEATMKSEPLLSTDSIQAKEEKLVIDGFTFPLGTVKELECFERRIQACTETKTQFITLLRSLKTHDTSLSDTYQRLFTDALTIHYNYDGISPKYNKRSLKSLSIFTECMPAAWNDHMDANMVREAIIEAVKKSHNRYNQCSHRKRTRQVYF
ncbi:uncharacterized protein LOC131430693 isoform X2 [Malaya genurostris]|uniref:uncharacterized protein LOC131430693 isoform X2 n=1 Tax=Malaya genurostris TaxID=325434 RepID=UPI0026F3FE3B|nr:uncharacterized protein LOC131430693 isoform X2 [Malaya genurostris]